MVVRFHVKDKHCILGMGSYTLVFCNLTVYVYLCGAPCSQNNTVFLLQCRNVAVCLERFESLFPCFIVDVSYVGFYCLFVFLLPWPGLYERDLNLKGTS